MMFSTCLLAAALVTAAPTNAPTAFSTEAERTFVVPDISERNVWLDVGVGFVATASNRVEIAFGPDSDGDGLLDDDEAAPVATWRLARVRLNGPEVAEARISLQRNRHATVFLVR